MHNIEPKWYLVRTKQHKEAFVRSMLSRRIPDCFLPLLRTSQKQWGRMNSSIVPLFPGYIFANFNFDMMYKSIQRMPGVVGVVCAGSEPSEVSTAIIHEIKRRESDGVIELPPKAYRIGEPVNVISGPLSGLNAVFDHYLSGSERVALILTLIGGASVRVILPSQLVAPTNDTISRERPPRYASPQ